MVVDELDKLIVDEESIDKNGLVNLLFGKVKVNKNGEVILDEKVLLEAGPKKILYFLLGKKVAAMKITKDGLNEAVDRNEIANAVGVEPKSVSKYLGRELKGFVKSTAGNFSVANYNLSKCKGYLHE